MPLQHEHVRQAQHHFQSDQQDHDQFEPGRAVRLDHVGQRPRRLDDHVELAFQRLRPLVEFVFVVQPLPQAFQIGPVPEDIRLVLDRDAAGDAVLDQQGLADQLQHRLAIPGRPALRRQIRGERLDRFEDAVHKALVPPERHRFRQRVCDDEKALAVEFAQRDGAARRNLLVLARRDDDRRRLVVDPLAWPEDTRLDTRENVVFLERRQADQHDDAKAIDRRKPAFADMEGERRGGDQVVALEAARVDAVADEQRMSGQPADIGRRRLDGGDGCVHVRIISRFRIAGL